MCDVPGFEEVACVQTPPPPLRENRRRGPFSDVCVKLNLSMNRSTHKMPNLFHLALIFKVRNKTPTLLLNVTKNKKINSHPSEFDFS